jgi:hypothetical protein
MEAFKVRAVRQRRAEQRVPCREHAAIGQQGEQHL